MEFYVVNNARNDNFNNMNIGKAYRSAQLHVFDLIGQQRPLPSLCFSGRSKKKTR